MASRGRPEGRHADQHRAARVRQAVEDRALVTLRREFPRDREAGRSRADDRDPLGTRRDLGHDVGDAGRLVPLDEEALHRADGQRAVDVAAPAGALAGSRADVRAHRRDRVRLTREDVPLFEAALGGEVQIAAAIRPDRTGFLALDIALQPGGVDGLDEEFLGGVDGQAGTCLSLGLPDSGANGGSAVRRPCQSTIRLVTPAKSRGGRSAVTSPRLRLESG